MREANAVTLTARVARRLSRKTAGEGLKTPSRATESEHLSRFVAGEAARRQPRGEGAGVGEGPGSTVSLLCYNIYYYF